jgi:hypothetical protein
MVLFIELNLPLHTLTKYHYIFLNDFGFFTLTCEILLKYLHTYFDKFFYYFF